MDSQTICDLVGGDLLRLNGITINNDKALRKALKGKWANVMLPSGKTGYVPSKHASCQRLVCCSSSKIFRCEGNQYPPFFSNSFPI